MTLLVRNPPTFILRMLSNSLGTVQGQRNTATSKPGCRCKFSDIGNSQLTKLPLARYCCVVSINHKSFYSCFKRNGKEVTVQATDRSEFWTSCKRKFDAHEIVARAGLDAL